MNKKYIRILAEMAIILSAAGIMTGCVNKRTEDVSSSRTDIVITTDNEITADETTTDEIIADSSSNIESSSSLNDNSLNDSSECSSDSSEVNDSNSIDDTQNNIEVEQTEVAYTETASNQSNFEVCDNEQYVGEPVQSREVESVEDNNKSVGDVVTGDYEPSEHEKTLLVNLTAREYGSDWVSTYDKAKVVATVMNRVEADEFPDTIYDVVSQPGQFDGYLPSDSYTYQVTDDCIAAVDYYFDHPDEFGDYKYFYGDGRSNYFY